MILGRTSTGSGDSGRSGSFVSPFWRVLRLPAVEEVGKAWATPKRTTSADVKWVAFIVLGVVWHSLAFVGYALESSCKIARYENREGDLRVSGE